MNDILHDIATLSNAVNILGDAYSASDERRAAVAQLENMLEEKQQAFSKFEDDYDDEGVLFDEF